VKVYPGPDECGVPPLVVPDKKMLAPTHAVALLAEIFSDNAGGCDIKNEFLT
jgi:hypothetical protein